MDTIQIRGLERGSMYLAVHAIDRSHRYPMRGFIVQEGGTLPVGALLAVRDQDGAWKLGYVLSDGRVHHSEPMRMGEALNRLESILADPARQATIAAVREMDINRAKERTYPQQSGPQPSRSRPTSGGNRRQSGWKSTRQPVQRTDAADPLEQLEAALKAAWSAMKRLQEQ